MCTMLQVKQDNSVPWFQTSQYGNQAEESLALQGVWPSSCCSAWVFGAKAQLERKYIIITAMPINP